jgi:hypothetical protein
MTLELQKSTPVKLRSVNLDERWKTHLYWDSVISKLFAGSVRSQAVAALIS